MSSQLISTFLFLFFALNLSAETNSSSNFFETYIDDSQKTISKKVVKWSNGIDKTVSSLLNSSDENMACNEETIQNSIDEFFQSEKFINETEKSYLHIRIGSHLQSKTSTTFNYRVSAQLPLSRTKKNYKLFIDDIEQNYFDDTASNTSDETTTPDIGINYFAKEFHKIESKYSIGFRGFSAFIRARYSKTFKAGRWVIEPTQQFKYSTRYFSEEETNIYFDRKLDDLSMFRASLYRKTMAHYNGMDYRVAFSYYLTPKTYRGVSLSQIFWGNTKYRYTIDSTTPATQSEPFGGISDYVTTLNFRRSIWRKWIAYEVQPAISFHRENDYKVNYMLQLKLNFYFGSI
ncbi:hypothetical protein HUE87_01770 [Candidatus Sulfurimonas marisnigri]|uniref:DUF3570 domain-containing protein n=1 Tax=Candidatus Sulfurimonas marisnigri TaxID=2740405 RepID=A0A7S7M0Z7_9BACT|nr:hypothetical protein [Candidatus Sulfurimonas marisnigri]QOY54998.1 hypothetical protein HUE87_01770 [Candidatus Sulfurimonas marisnigri]